MQRKIGFKLKNLSGDDIVSLIKANDSQTLKLLYKANFGKVRRYVLKNSGDQAQAKDVYQEAFVILWRNIRNDKFTVSTTSSIEGYLFQIAKHKWLDHLRSVRYKNTTFINREPEFDQAEIEENEEKNKKIKIIMESMGQLGERCQRLLKLFYFERKSFREIAAITGLDEASARNAKYRCQEQLKRITQTIPNENK